MKIGNVQVNNKLFLAPMAGVTDVGFRAIASFFGAEITYTEMVSAKGLIYGKGKALSNSVNSKFLKENPKFAQNKSAWLLLNEQNDKIKAVQIFGSDSKFMAKACEDELLDDFDIIDINMGCPAPKIIKNGDGSALMENLNLAQEIIVSCCKVSKRPVTVKFRKGFKQDNAVLFAKMCEQAGASAITIHARLTTQGYSGVVDYETIKKVKECVSIPVFGSGDVKDKESLKKMLETNVDGVLIGRASFGNLEIFKQLNEFVKNAEPVSMVSFVTKDNFFSDVLTQDDLKNLENNEKYVKYICAKKHISILSKYFSESYIVKYMRKHMLWYAGCFKNPLLKQEIAKSENLDYSLKILKELILSDKQS